MKRVAWILSMILITVISSASLTAVPAAAFAACEDTACKRNNQCTPQCSGCSAPNPILGGHCEVRAPE